VYDGQKALHLVSAWATQRGVVLGQVATAAHSNEITAIPALLQILDVRGATVTIDAAGCQKAIARQVCAQGQWADVLPYHIDHIIAQQHGGETVTANLAQLPQLGPIFGNFCPYCDVSRLFLGRDFSQGNVVPTYPLAKTGRAWP
jgi:hypothetical protein